MPALQNLARAIRPHPDNDGTVERRYGTLTAVSTTPYVSCTVEIDGKSPACPGCGVLSSYTPNVGDLVVCLVVGLDIIVIGAMQ